MSIRYSLLLLGLFLGIVGLAQAEFFYDQATGWRSSDNTLEERLKQGLENPDALRRMNDAAARYAQGDKEEARKEYREVVRRYPTSMLAPQAHYQIAQIRLEQKKIDKAYEAYGHIVGGYPSYTGFTKLINEMFTLAEKLQTEKTVSVLGLWNYRDRDAAINAFEKIVTVAPYSDYAPRALDLIARLYKEKDEPLSAIDAYQRLIGSYPTHPLAPDAYMAVAEIYRSMEAGAPYDQGATQQAIRYYEEFSTLYPNDPRVPEATGKISQLNEIFALGKYDLAIFYYEKRNNLTAASSLLREVINIAPESATAQKAQKMLEKIAEGRPAKKEAGKSFVDSLIFWKNEK